MSKVELHIFTNSAANSPSTKIIMQTYKSFCDTFGPVIPAGVWMDSKPNVRKAMKYKENLTKQFRVVHSCESLSDGYINAVKSSTADYLFCLEHDWVFKKEFIHHDLEQIIDCMKAQNVYHMRFNKRANELKGWDTTLEENSYGDFKWCKTNILSNNPHIINRKKILDFINKKYIVVKPGSKGIEEVISAKPETWGAIYGPLGHPNTVWHTDGKKVMI